MNLQPVTGPEFTCYCQTCNKRLVQGKSTIYADIDGPSFKFYCEYCAAKFSTSDKDTERPITQENRNGQNRNK